MDENISRAAGAAHGQVLDEADFHRIAGYRPDAPLRAAHDAVRASGPPRLASMTITPPGPSPPLI
ncbi:MAG: hypothetical protein WKF47_14030 [Geodermatophilaceae bacterium]